MARTKVEILAMIPYQSFRKGRSINRTWFCTYLYLPWQSLRMKLHININADSLIKHHSLPVSVTTSEDTKQILNSTSNRQTNIHQHEILRKYIFLISSFLSRFQIKNYFIEKPEPTDYNISVIPKTHLITTFKLSIISLRHQSPQTTI